MKAVVAIFAVLPFFLSRGADAQLLLRGGGTAPYIGLCDLLAGGCSAAYSFARSLRTAYAGNLFQLTRLSDSATADIGQSNHLVYQSSIDTFCKNTSCYYSKLYDQSGNGNDMSILSATDYTNPPYGTDNTSGVPRFSQYGGTYFLGAGDTYFYWQAPAALVTPQGSTTGLNTGNTSKSIYEISHSEAVTICCGHAGQTYLPISSDHGNSQKGFILGPSFYDPAPVSSPAFNYAVEIEYDGVVPGSGWFGSYGSYFEYLDGMVVFDAGINRISAFVNGSQIVAPIAPASPLNTGAEVGIAGLGDATSNPTIVYELAITNHAVNSTEIAAAHANASVFLAARSPSPCNAIADNWGFFGGWGLWRMDGSYTGPLVRLVRASDSATLDVGTTSGSSCDFDATTAATFCASTTCKASILYNQSIRVQFSQSGSFDMTQGTDANRPTYSASCAALNSKPCLLFAGTQTMCTATLSASAVTTDPHAPTPNSKGDASFPSIIAQTWFYVAATTIGSPAFQAVIGGISTSNPFFGFGSSANKVTVDLSVSGSHAVQATASDNVGHLVAMTTPGDGTAALIVDGSSSGGTSQSTSSVPHGYCVGSQNSAPGSFFTGQFGVAAIQIPQLRGILTSGELAALRVAVQSYWSTP